MTQEKSEYLKNLQVMCNLLDAAQMNSKLAQAHLETAVNKANEAVEELNDAGERLKAALQKLGEIRSRNG